MGILPRKIQRLRKKYKKNQRKPRKDEKNKEDIISSFNELDNKEIKEISKIIEDNGQPHQKKFINEFMKKYNSGEKLNEIDINDYYDCIESNEYQIKNHKHENI